MPLMLEDALRILLASARPGGWEYVGVDEDLVGRVLAEDLMPGADIPRMHTCAKDGYLVRADGAWPGEALISGECGPGEIVKSLEPGEAVIAYSGCLVEDDLAALVPVEEVVASQGQVAITRRPRALENIIPRGSGARAGEAVLSRGHIVTPLDVELIEMLGRRFVRVYRRPRVAIISVGSEISLEAPSRTTRYVTVKHMVRALGGEAVNMGTVEDSPSAIASAITESMASADLVVTLGGTGPSAHDVTYLAAESLGPSEIFRGIDVAEAARSCGAVVRGKPLLMLPGPRAPALNGATILLAPIIMAFAGSTEGPYRIVHAKLSRRIHMPRRGIVWVRLREGAADPVHPDYYGISPSTADGYLIEGPGDLVGDVKVHVPRFL